MNIRQVLRTYSLLRALTDDESALLETLRKMNDSERELLVESLSPGRTTTKKTGKKSSSKSSRASKLSTAIRDNLQRRVETEQSNDDPNDRCQKTYPGGIVCDEPADANVHHLRGATGYHEFVSPQSKAMAASVGDDATPAASGE